MLVSVSSHPNPIKWRSWYTSPVEVGRTTLYPTFKTKDTQPSSCQDEGSHVHMNDLQLPGISWLKDTPPFLPWGHLVNVRAQRPGLHAGQLYRAILAPALSGISWGLCYNSVMVQLLPLPNAASFTSLRSLFLRPCVPRSPPAGLPHTDSQIRDHCPGNLPVVNCVPPQFIWWSPHPQNMTVFGNKVFKKVIWVTTVSRMGAHQNDWCPYRRRKFGHTHTDTRHLYTQRDDHDGRERLPFASQGERSLKGLTLPAPASGTVKKIHLLGLNRPGCDIMWRQQLWINIPPKTSSEFLYLSILQMRIRGSERLNNSPKVTEPESKSHEPKSMSFWYRRWNLTFLLPLDNPSVTIINPHHRHQGLNHIQ